MRTVHARLRSSFVPAAVVVSLLVLAFYAGRQSGAPSSDSSAQPVPMQDPPAAVPNRNNQLAAVFASVPLLTVASSAAAPSALALQLPDDMPVMEVIELLDEQARAGDADAACRIGAELQRCRELQGGGDWFERQHIEELARQPISGEALAQESSRLDEVIARRARLKQQCGALKPDLERQAFRYHLAAGLRGNADSAMQVVGGGLVDGREWMRSAEFYTLYRAHAWQLFRIAFEAGHPLAVLEWQTAASSDLSLLSGLMPEDWRQPEVAAALSARVFPRARPGQPTPEPQASGPAQAEADRLYAAHFANSSWRSPERDTPALRDRPISQRALESTRLRPCEPGDPRLF